REPLQIPTAVQAQTPAFITWLRNIFGRYTGRAPGLRLTVAVMAGLAGLLLGWVLYLAFFGASLGRVRNARIQGAVPDEVVAGRRLLMEQQFEKALAAAAAGRLVEAWHWLAQGFIVGLAHRKLVRLDWSKTNREYVRELQSQSAALYAVARRFFGTADRVVYGGKATSVEEVRRFHDELLAAL
ncbi:MAG TPA: DUF4129 domain-containing protein, partial [bacterium]|nr:DUF4129 domain-containing protein [bacterium]